MYKQTQTARAVIPRPTEVTPTIGAQAVERRIAFFSKVFTKEDVLAHPKSVYSTIINSPDELGNTLETTLGSVDAKTAMTSILFKLTTGYTSIK